MLVIIGMKSWWTTATRTAIAMYQRATSNFVDGSSIKDSSTNLRNYLMKDEEIGFNWTPYSNDWDSKYEELVLYHNENGHCNVPVRHEQLGNWVNRQRQQYKLEKLSAERIRRLEEIGFKWTVYSTHGIVASVAVERRSNTRKERKVVAKTA